MKSSSDKKYTIAVLGSHSALEVCFGAKKQGFKTLVVVEKGRDKTYAKYYRIRHPEFISGSSEIPKQVRNDITYLGCVDDTLEVNRFKDILNPAIQRILLDKNCIFIPHRSFEVYLNDYDAIEKKFSVPIFGNKFLLRSEERTEKPNQYDILEKAGIKYPKRFNSPNDIDRLVIVKVSEKERTYERKFFLADSSATYTTKKDSLINQGKITQEALDKAVIEEFVIGVQVNFNFFYSAVNHRLELIGTDTRRQTNLDGLLRLPTDEQSTVLNKMEPTYEEAGHVAVTVLESLLEQAFDIGERFVAATKEMFAPGVIGPFGLQAVITAGPPKKEIVVFDVAPRMPGSPGIAATPYSSYLYGKPVSMGERVAMEIKEAIEKDKLNKVLT